MAQIDRLNELLSIFDSRRYPIKPNDLLSLVDYSQPTLKRYIGKLRGFGAPIRYDFQAQGYILDKTEDDAIQLPGLWFNVSELHSLLTINELIDQLDPGLLKAELMPLRKLIEKKLAARGVKIGELSHRIRFLGIKIRLCCPQAVRSTATALIRRKRLKLCYHSRGENKIVHRQVSPQRLLYYRGNWYLAVYCHTRRALRTLALERISEIVPLDTDCMEIDDQKLNDYFTSSFGIFAGQPKGEAVLIFSQESARWVAEEQWHPDQKGRFLTDGTFELRLPYADQTELVMEILRYGPEVRVVSPPQLKNEVINRLEQARLQYEKK